MSNNSKKNFFRTNFSSNLLIMRKKDNYVSLLLILVPSSHLILIKLQKNFFIDLLQTQNDLVSLNDMRRLD